MDINKKNISTWDKVAPNFGKVGPRYWEEFGSRLVELSSISRRSRVLDIGMGRGASLFPALNQVQKDGFVMGIDSSEVMVSVLIQTSDNKFAIGQMNEDTAFPFKLQFIGGGIDKGDIKGEILDLEHNIKKEILEELGIEAKNKDIVKSLKPCYLKSGGKSKFLSAIFKLMALYIASNGLSSVSWAIPFGKKEVETMLNNIDEMLKYYDYFNTSIPNWYKSELFNEI